MRHSDALNIVGAVASITSVAIVFWQSSNQWAIVALVVACSSVALAWILYVRARKHGPADMGRDSLLDSGRRLISASSASVIMFGKDLSWAMDYAGALETALRRGASITILCVAPSTDETRRAIDVLRAMKVHVIEVPKDHGIRATLIDHETQHTARLFVAQKKRLEHPATPDEFVYQCKTYYGSSDAMLINAMVRVSQMSGAA